jgi:hypothetical protein
MYVPVETEDVQDLLSEIEGAIVAQIAQLEDYGVLILNSPDKKRVTMRAQALVFFSGSSDEKPGADGKLASSTLNFSINLQMQDQRSHQIAYPIIMAMRKLLQGFRPEVSKKTGRFWLRGVDYQPFERGERLTWSYSLTFSLQLLY